MRKVLAVLFSLVMASTLYADSSPWRYVHMGTTTPGTAAFSILNGPGVLHSLTINTAGASAVISVFDLPSSGSGAAATCSGTPSTRVIAVITLPASGALPGTLLYDVSFQQGLCYQSATAGSDVTAAIQP